MRDFIGNELKVGNFVAMGGSGNTRAEYGMILLKVVETGENLKLVRLTATYPKGTAKIGWKKVTARKSNKYVLVNPSNKVQDLFDRAVSGDLREGENRIIGRWVHGSLDPEVLIGL